MTNSDLSPSPVLFMNEWAWFLWQRCLFKHGLGCISVLEFGFNCIWPFASFSLLFSVLQNVLPRSYYFNLPPEGLKLLYSAKRFLLYREDSLECVFPSIWLCTIVLANKSIICANIHGKGQNYLQGKLSSVLCINLHSHHCYFLILVCTGFTGKVYGREVWLPGDLWATCYLWASLNPIRFVGGGEG